MYTKGPYTPPDVEGTMLTFPSTLGGGNWSGFSYDPTLGLAFTSVMNIGQVAKMVQGTARGSTIPTWVRRSPWGGAVGRFWNPETKIPCSAGPFGELVAVDVNRGEIAWKVPLGFFESLKEKGFGNTGTLNIGGSIATAGGVVFIGATIDCRFRAFESKTGKQLWETALPACAHTTPMTFLGKDGRQYVVVAAGGGSFLGAPPGSNILAFALPRGTRVRSLIHDARAGGGDGRGGPRAGRRRSGPHAQPRASTCSRGRTSATDTSTIRSRTRSATIERLGRESGAYDTFIRTDSQLITKHPITFPAGTGIATGESFNVRNLDYFDAIFFFGVREIDLSPEQRADLLSFVKDDGKGFVAAHSAATAFFSWPEFGEMLGGRFDEHPWGITDGTVVVDDPAFPAMRHLPPHDGVPRRALSDQGFFARQDPRARAPRRVEAGSDEAARAPQGRRLSRRRGRRPMAVAACSIRFSATTPTTGTTPRSRRCTTRRYAGRSAWWTATPRRPRPGANTHTGEIIHGLHGLHRLRTGCRCAMRADPRYGVRRRGDRADGSAV